MPSSIDRHRFLHAEFATVALTVQYAGAVIYTDCISAEG